MRVKWDAVLELIGFIVSTGFLLRTLYMLTIYSIQTTKVMGLTWIGMLFTILATILMYVTAERLYKRMK